MLRSRRIRGSRRCAATASAVLCLAVPFHLALASEADPADGTATSDDEAVHEHAHEHDHDGDHVDERIVVTATPLEHSPDELAVPVIQIDRQQVLQDLGSTLGETLATQPGVATTGFTGGASRPVIRGQDAFRTEVLEGGLSTQDVSRLSPDHAVPVNALSAESVEVVRGPAVLRYGGGASAGVVNALTNRVPRLRIEEPLRGELVGAYGKNEDQGDFNGRIEGGFGPLAWRLDGMYRDAGNYQRGDDKTQRGSDTETWTISPGASLITDFGRIGFAYTRFESEYGIPEDEPVEIDLETDRYRFEGDLFEPFEGVREIRLRGIYSDYEHDEIADGVTGQTFDNDEFDGRLELLHEPLFGFVGALGFHGRAQDLKASGEAAEFLDQSDTEMFAAYFFEERPLAEHFDLQVGARFEGTWVDGTPISGRKRNRAFAPISGSVSSIYHPNENWTIGLTGSVSQRAPAQVELFARGPHEATSTFEVGDPDFDEETAYTAELRVRGAFERFDFDLSLFSTYYDDFIAGLETGVTVDEEGNPDPDGDLDELFYRQRNASFLGGELTAGAHLVEFAGGSLRTEWQLDYVRARFTSGSGENDIPRIPPMRWGGSLVYVHDRVYGRFGFMRHESQWNATDLERDTDDFVMLDLALRVKLPMLEDLAPTELSFMATNLLDVGARNAVSFNVDEVKLPGRNFRIGLRTEF
ncbi:MAG: TonB-dependent receptor [Myxococcota bacterium]|nr:TonB-dependent receptor [Myxococcota bacterium]